MRSIFDHKQYDGANLDGGYVPVSLLKEIYGVQWTVLSQDYLSEKYHNRELNLQILEDNIKVDDYVFAFHPLADNYYLKYQDGSLIMSYMGERNAVVSKKMSFKEASKIVKEKKYEEYFQK